MRAGKIATAFPQRKHFQRLQQFLMAPSKKSRIPKQKSNTQTNKGAYSRRDDPADPGCSRIERQRTAEEGKWQRL